MKHQFAVLLAGVALCAGFGVGRIAQAQSEIEPGQNARARAAEMKRRGIKVRALSVENVAPSVIAWWLDPKNQPEPALFRREEARVDAGKDRDSTLPPGVERIVAIDPQNALLVFATDAGWQSIQETVAFLDKPLRQVEIEAQFVQISPENARQLGIERPATPAAKTTLQLNFVRSDFHKILAQLVAQNKAKIVTAPRVIAINNLQTNLPTGTEIRFLVTPTINNDDTVTLLISTSLAPKMTMQNDKTLALATLALAQQKGIVSVVNVRDGDTVALSGLASDFSPTVPHDLDAASQGIIFVTPRIVRRAEDDRAAAAKQ